MTAITFPALDAVILARRDTIVAGLAALVPRDALITSGNERRAFKTDGLTVYRRIPMAVVLPRKTAEVSAVMRFCHEQGVNVVPRGAGTSLAGDAIPQEDAVVVGIAKTNPRARDRLCQSLRARRGGRDQPRHYRRGDARKLFSTRPISHRSWPAP